MNLITKFKGSEDSIYFPNFYKGKKIVYKKYNDFFMASILANHPIKGDVNERIVRLTKEQFIEESKSNRFASVVKNRKQQMELRNNFLTLPNVQADGQGNVSIECFTKDTQYTNIETAAVVRAFMALMSNGKEAMGLVKVLELAASNKEARSQGGYTYVPFQIHASYIGACFGIKGALNNTNRAKFNKLMDLMEEYYPEFGIERQEVQLNPGTGLKPAKCIVGKYTRLKSNAARKTDETKEIIVEEAPVVEEAQEVAPLTEEETVAALQEIQDAIVSSANVYVKARKETPYIPAHKGLSRRKYYGLS